MAEFFKGWRRTIGVMTLAFALMFTSEWMRSKSVPDDPPIVGRHTDFTAPNHIPYWCVAIPLALLSVYLLLGKPRVAKPQRTIEPDRA